MPYCLMQEVLLNHNLITDTTDERAAISMFITRVDGLIDDKLRGKVTLPFTVVPQSVKMAALDLVTYYELRRLTGANMPDPPEWIREYKEDAEAILSEIAACQINFDTDAVTQSSGIDSNTKGLEKIFDLGDVYDQETHPTDADERYGEA